MDKKICSECGTENENDYIYCKNCGALLTAAPKPENEQPEHKLTAEAAPALRPRRNPRHRKRCRRQNSLHLDPLPRPKPQSPHLSPFLRFIIPKTATRDTPKAALPHPTEYRRRK